MLYVAADLHLSPTIWNNLPSLRGDSYAALDQIVDTCVTAPAPSALLLCGDIFDKPKPDSESVERFRAAMDRLRDAGVKVYAIQGQHEKADPPWATALGAAHYVGNGVPFNLDVANGTGTCDKPSVIGLDYTSSADLKQKLKETLKQVKKLDILMLHQMAKQAIDIDGAWNFDIEWVKKGVKLVLMGDYHEHLNVGRLWYPGATHMRNIGEVGPKYFLRINTPDMTVEPIVLQTRPVLEVRAVTEDQLSEAVAEIMDFGEPQVREEIATPLVIARYAPSVRDVVPRIEEACQSRGFMLRFKTLVSDAKQGESELPQSDATLQGCLDQLVNRDDDEQLHSFVSSLLTAPDTKTVLDETKQQLGIGE